MAAAIPGPVATPEESLRYACTPAYRITREVRAKEINQYSLLNVKRLTGLRW